ncbi:G3BP-like protein [Pleurostoma richardsiae]|uniref:G3BP-like protein n=1 Tax=Pleurostoma richardsiae TaxID=41990 RepID=A0AA38RQC6_9PEZI|nr:G3BP-like protein [Pleurostoma richardsiae]
MATNGTTNHQDQYKASGDHYAATTGPADASNPSNSNLSKDEVGWYFVEQYYTTLSKSPEKLHLFYGKRSQFVYGLEAEVANVSVGRQAIQDRIKELDFHDCKVRISNVDSQASFENIVIQVIGETSNKAGEPKKFVQTFVLAQQPSGYFVLNDILRYINEEGDDEPVEAAREEVAPASETEASQAPETLAEPEPIKSVEAVVEEAPAAQLDATVIEKKLEEVSSDVKETPSTTAAGTPVETAPPADDAATKPEPAAATLPDPEKAAEEIAEEEVKKPEAPKDPSPTPVAPRVPAPAAAEPEKPKEPPKPMTWASRAAAAAGTAARPAVALPKTATPPAQPRTAAPPAAASQPSPAAQTTEASPAAESKDSGSEWQTAGADSKRQNRPQSISQPPTEKEGTMGYVKYVTEKVKADDLKATLASYGELVYFDINRGKNCAFVEFATAAGYQAAIAANPHVVNGENIVVEPRRPKAGAYGGSNYQAGRGSISGRGRGGYDRAGSQGGGRGGFTGSARGRGGAQRGRGGAPTASA